jgi:alkaline phosphatase
LTGLVVTNTVNHATPAYKDIPVVVAGPLLIIEYRLLAYSSHVRNRNALGAIAEQELGYSGILRQKLDVLFGGGCCHFRPRRTSGSCSIARIASCFTLQGQGLLHDD